MTPTRTWPRTRHLIATQSSDYDYYKVGLLTRGSCQLSQNGRQTTLLPGDLALLLGVRAWIDANLGEPGLDPDAIARANHVSVRYLHRLFHDKGTSVARWVRERRLDNCRRDLEDPAQAERGVVAIARRWGFVDPAHFSKIFKASYGEPRGQYRHRSKAVGEPREAMTQAAR